MYRPAHFAEDRPEVLAALLRRHPLGLLVTQDADGALDANPIPFLLDPDPAGGPGILRGHVARANPVWREARTDRASIVVFQGPQAYVSPSWYPSKREHGKVVPIWDYIAVEARGRLGCFDDPARLHALVVRLTDRHEATRDAPWAVGDAPAPFVATLLGAIVGIDITLDTLVGKWKASQNRSAADREGVAAGLAAEATGAHVDPTGARAMAAAVLGKGEPGAISPPRG